MVLWLVYGLLTLRAGSFRHITHSSMASMPAALMSQATGNSTTKVIPSHRRKGKKKSSDGDPPKAKPVHGTFTADEAARLLTWLPKYMQIKRQPGRKLTGFWEPMLADLFLHHPLPPLTPEEIAAGVDQGDRIKDRTKVSVLSNFLSP